MINEQLEKIFIVDSFECILVYISYVQYHRRLSLLCLLLFLGFVQLKNVSSELFAIVQTIVKRKSNENKAKVNSIVNQNTNTMKYN